MTRFEPGTAVTWVERLRDGYEFTYPVAGVVVRSTSVRVIIRVTKRSGEQVERAVRPEALRVRRPEEGEEGAMRRARLVGRVCDPRPSVGQWRTVYYAFEAQGALECDGCHGPIGAGETFSRPEINQRTQRFSRVYYCRHCVPFSQVEEQG